MPRELLFVGLLMASVAIADESRLDIGGHTKVNLRGTSYPSDSLIRDLIGSNSLDLQADLRVNLEWRKAGWTFDAAYQLVGLSGDSLELGSSLPPGSDFLFPRLPNDDRRLFNFTSVIADSSDSALLHRLDRIWIGHTSEKTVLRFGRQALSWGNGLFYAPMDLVNPFDPSTIDTEFKTGDDMLYGQYLRDSGDDVQGAFVFRRNPLTGDAEYEESTVAVKYHGFAGEYEYDVLVADNYADPTLGLGAGRGVGGAVVQGDVVITRTSNDTILQFVANATYSWTAWDKNMSGVLEYFYNGFGQSSGKYDPLSLAGNPDLLARIARGQLFTLGRHYFASSVTVEMTPLWTVTPVLLANVGDPSALLQLTTNYSLGDDIVFLGSINIPIGSSGTEFGGIETGIPGRFFSSGAGFFAQFAWYF